MKCSDCRHKMIAYLDSELTPQVRRRMTQHIQQCPMCYTVYIQQRDVAHELAYALPLVGRATRPRYDKMWAAIQANMARKSSRQRYHARYGLAALALILALLLPWTVGQPRMAALAALPTQPSPAATASRTAEMGGARALATLAPLYTSVLTPEPHAVRVPGAPDGTP